MSFFFGTHWQACHNGIKLFLKLFLYFFFKFLSKGEEGFRITLILGLKKPELHKKALLAKIEQVEIVLVEFA